MSILNNIATGADNKTHDIGRISWIVSMVTIISSAAAILFTKGVIDLMSLASAIGVITTSHGVALFAKQQTEPAAPPPPSA